MGDKTEDNKDIFYVYLMRTTGNTLYTGQTNNLKRRVKQHELKGKRGSKYIQRFLGSKLVYYETYPTRSEAMKREHQIKKLSHKEKEALVSKNKHPLDIFDENQ